MVRTDRPLLLYDGVCALCHAAVTFVLTRDRSRAVRFAALHGETATRLRDARPELAGIDSIIWIDASGRAFTRSAAALAIGRHIGGGWAALATLLRIVPAPLREALYDRVARARFLP